MKSKFTLIVALFFATYTFAQNTKCTNVVYHSTYYLSPSKLEFVHLSTISSTLTFCMSETHLQLNNQAGTYITLTKFIDTITTVEKTEMMYGGVDRYGKSYIVSYVFRDSGPFYTHMVVEIQDIATGILSKYYLNPF